MKSSPVQGMNGYRNYKAATSAFHLEVGYFYLRLLDFEGK
jgi:hypothetical protein